MNSAFFCCKIGVIAFNVCPNPNPHNHTFGCRAGRNGAAANRANSSSAANVAGPAICCPATNSE